MKRNKEAFFQGLVSQTGVTISNIKNLKPIDAATIENFRFISANEKTGTQIFRTLMDASDSNYILAINFYPRGAKGDTITSFNYLKYTKEKKFVPEIACFRFEIFQRMYNDAERCKVIMSVDNALLRKLNADIGFIYNVKMDIMFKERYQFCKVLSYQKFNKAIVNQYYFYNGLVNDEYILKKIYDQADLITINN